MSPVSKVYGATYSTCTQRVLFLLEELGIPYELVSISMKEGEHKTPTFVDQQHPFGRLPAFEDATTKVFESRAICYYLAAKYGGPLRPPCEDVKLSRFQQAASVEYSYFDPPITQLAYQKLFKRQMGQGEPDEQLVHECERRIQECLDYYEQLLGEDEYLAGKKFTLVDIFHAPWIAFLSRLEMESDISSRKNLNAWWDRVRNRPAWMAVTNMA
ncbi:hypothetical protein ASPCAL03351 [Aspergillus calidoustus]|uniref:glutathione transferase n=1 Tax=Aspergillus calidoustus TaxID=454130 RepID=A0A0U5FS63_ASPCI|nr:hypothetical protein ASPCAL03351 [Aspergillus calidoustus]